MKVDQGEKVKRMLTEGKFFISFFDNLVSNISEMDIDEYIKKMNKKRGK